MSLGNNNRKKSLLQACVVCLLIVLIKPYLCLYLFSFHYSINSDDEGNTSIESRDQSESHLEDVSLNESIQRSTEETAYESPK